jgi:hypothetical protein
MQTVQLSNEDMIKYILNFIRYDIPILMSGKSSIGKSYTMLEMAKQWGLPNSVLYVGSEKADNIEGLPKLMDEKSVEKENVLTYFKPYWFPQSNLIQNAVKKGQDIFDKKIKPNFSDKSSYELPYETVMGLVFAIGNSKFEGNKTTQNFRFIDNTRFIYSDRDNEIINKDIELSRELVPKGEDVLKYKNELYELSIYLCTLAGLGNYWLLLDELDKVQPEEADKFAPMLHIVRERRLKNYSLRELNDGKGADVAMNVVANSYINIYNTIKNSLETNQSVLDTRIIAISNKTDNIIDINDALFKRFVQIVISDILLLKPVDPKLQSIRTCLLEVETKIGSGSKGDLTLGFLEEINLQWQFGFLPRILQSGDSSGNFIRNNYLEKMSAVMTMPEGIERDEKVIELKKQTALYKLCLDNFGDENKIVTKDADGNETEVLVSSMVMECLSSQLSPQKIDEIVEVSNPMDLIRDIQSKGLNDKDTALEVYDVLMEKYKNLPTNENRSMELEKLIDYAFSFISHTAYADGYSSDKIKNNVEYSPLVINEYLIPLMIKFTLKAITKDEIISFDDKDILISHHSKLWDEFALPDHISKIKGNPEFTNELFYGGEDSLWGSPDLNANEFQGSFVNKYNIANFELFEEFIKAYIAMDETKKEEFKDFIEYIKEFRKDDVKAVMDKEINALKIARKALEVSPTLKKYKLAFDL